MSPSSKLLATLVLLQVLAVSPDRAAAIYQRESQPAAPLSRSIGLACGLHLSRTQRGWGFSISRAGSAALVLQNQPLSLEILDPSGVVTSERSAYGRVRHQGSTILATASIAGPDGSRFTLSDRWGCGTRALTLERHVTVSGASASSFASNISFPLAQPMEEDRIKYFAPGMIYGGPEHLSAQSIGGSLQRKRGGSMRIREDRMPAPLFGMFFPDGTSLALLDPAPNGGTTSDESHRQQATPMTDARFGFGSLGLDHQDGRTAAGFWFPGSEGDVTYAGTTYPGGQEQQWRRRFHPIQPGFEQSYKLEVRAGEKESFPAFTRAAWRWAFTALHPLPTSEDLPAIEAALTDTLASQVKTAGARTGIPNFLSSVSTAPARDSDAIMGFTGKNLEAAELLLAEANLDQDPTRARKRRQLAIAIFASFMHLKLNSPAGEGFHFKDGSPALAIERDKRVYLRSFTDDLKATLRAYRRERLAGHVHADWLAWVASFADWLLTQQNSDGSLPRSWHPGTGQVFDPSPASSYNAVPLLTLLAAETKQNSANYLQAAIRAANYSWTNGQAEEQFIGGTIDNPDILDKEAGTLTLEANLSLYRATGDKVWLNRARAAADYAETWIYLWNVPMPFGEDASMLHWKPGASTVGTQLIATGHSLVDEYMAFAVADYAELGRLTGDRHYTEIAHLLLCNTKEMVATAERPYDLRGPGWQQEHWSFAPPRGLGLHRGWLPWVATSQLQGIVQLREAEPAFYERWSRAPQASHGSHSPPDTTP